jgi:predicted GNAT family acetyltransferase
MSVHYSTDPAEVDWTHLKAVLEADDFCNGRTPDEYRRSAAGSFLNVYVWDGDTIIGNGRILSDGVCNAYIVDVWTATPYRRQGIGKETVRILCDSVPGQHVYLQTDDAFEFYTACGFSRHDFGMARIVGTWLSR